MLTDIGHSLRPAFVLLLLFTALTGIAYPLAITGIAQVVFPAQAGGSLIRENGKIIGSELIGQNFSDARYFHPRLSAAGKGYDASASAASNLAPASKDLADRISGDVAALRAQGVTDHIPADMVTTSASGLDPHISPETARLQVSRVAAARKMDPKLIQSAVASATEFPVFGLIGEPRVNVLLLNRQIDAISAKRVR